MVFTRPEAIIAMYGKFDGVRDARNFVYEARRCAGGSKVCGRLEDVWEA